MQPCRDEDRHRRRSSTGGTHSARRPSARLPTEYAVSVSATNGWNAAPFGTAA